MFVVPFRGVNYGFLSPLGYSSLLRRRSLGSSRNLKGIQDGTAIFLAIKISYRVAREEIIQKHRHTVYNGKF